MAHAPEAGVEMDASAVAGAKAESDSKTGASTGAKTDAVAEADVDAETKPVTQARAEQDAGMTCQMQLYDTRRKEKRASAALCSAGRANRCYQLTNVESMHANF